MEKVIKNNCEKTLIKREKKERGEKKIKKSKEKALQERERVVI